MDTKQARIEMEKRIADFRKRVEKAAFMRDVGVLSEKDLERLKVKFLEEIYRK